MAVALTINGLRFLFPGDLEKAGWLQLLVDNATFRDTVKLTDVLIASHHGRENGICEAVFDVVGCKPVIVVVSDDYHQYDTQKTIQYYGSKAKGFALDGPKSKGSDDQMRWRDRFRFYRTRIRIGEFVQCIPQSQGNRLNPCKTLGCFWAFLP